MKLRQGTIRELEEKGSSMSVQDRMGLAAGVYKDPLQHCDDLMFSIIVLKRPQAESRSSEIHKVRIPL